MKKLLLLLMMLVVGLAAQATVQTGISMQGMKRTVNGKTYFSFAIQTMWGGDQIPAQEGSSYTFSNATIAGVTLNGTLNFQEMSSFTDVITGSSFTVTIENSSLWFYGATVQTKSGTDVTGCSTSVSSNNHTLTVTIPSGKTFATIIVDYVSKAPFSSSNTVISGLENSYLYLGSPIEPEPVVTYNGSVLTKDTDYTLSYWGSNRVGEAQLTVTGMNEYAGAISKSYTIRKVALTDFNSLGNKTYEIATTTDLDYLALYITGSDDGSGITFKQTADIAYAYSSAWNDNYGENNFTAIGGYGNPFCGTYDGQNHTISGIRIYKNGTTNYDTSQGLFGFISSGAIVKKVILADAKIVGYNNTGGIVGYNCGTIEDCRVESNVDIRSAKQSSAVGGIAGISNGNNTTGVAISRCTFKGRVKHTAVNSTNVGGIVGTLTNCPVSNCLVLGAYVDGYDYSGAIAGYKTSNSTLTANYYHDSEVSNTDNRGGAYINVGVGIGSGSEDQAGARSVHAITLPDSVTATGESVDIDGATYYAAATTVTLSYSGEVPEGYLLIYSVNGTAIEGDTFVMPAANVTVTVQFVAIDYTIILPTDLEHGAITCDMATAHVGETVTLIVTPDAGYAVESLTVTNGDTPLEVTAGENNTYTFVMPAANVTVNATFAMVDYTINLPTDLEHVTIICDKATAHFGETVTLTVTTDKGYAIQSLTVMNGDTPLEVTAGENNTYTFVMPAANVTVNVEIRRLRYIFDSATGELALIWGQFNKNNKWGSDVTPWAVKSVKATNEVSFTSDCSQLFYNFTNCTSMDLSNVNTANVTNMKSMFNNCEALTALDLAGWNTQNVKNMSNMFYNCKALTALDISGWNTANVTDMNSMFSGCKALTSLDLSGWNTANVTTMRDMFSYCSRLTSLDIAGWNTQNVTNMSDMFYNCQALTALDIAGWNTQNVTDMSYMFRNCQALTINGISRWNTQNVTDMTNMFYNCKALTALDLSEWNTQNVTDMRFMFFDCTALTTLNLSGWNTAKVTDMSHMFDGCEALTTIYAGSGWSTDNVTNSIDMFFICHSLVGGNGTTYDASHVDAEYARIDRPDLPGYFTEKLLPRYTFDSATGVLALNWGEFNRNNKWGNDVPWREVKSVTATAEVSFTGDCSNLFSSYTNCTSISLDSVNTQSVTNMSNMFYNCPALTALDLAGWNTQSVTDMNSMFYNCQSLTSLDLAGWNTQNVTDMRFMFSYCQALTALDLAGWNTQSVTDMNQMFSRCSALTTLDLSGWNIQNVDNMNGMFSHCQALTSLDLSGLNTQNVTDMSHMFNGCSSLTSLNIARWNTQNVTNMGFMFYGCEALTTLDIAGWNTANVTDMRDMFSGCSALTSLDLSGWNTANVTDMTDMFRNCSRLASIYAGTDWSTENLRWATDMFTGCTNLVGGLGTTYDASHVNAEYARIDRPDLPGYFTEKSALALGDLNGDGNVDVIDVSVLIDIILDKPVTLAAGAVTDINGDGNTDVIDVSFLIDMILQ